jgi:integrase
MPIARKLPSGSWNCKVFSHYEYKDGKKVMVKKSFTVDDPSPAGKRRCEEMASTWAAHKKEAPHQVDVRTAIRQYIDVKKGVLSPSTVAAYEKYLKTGAFDQIGAIQIRKLRQIDVQRWISSFAADHSPKYTKNVYLLFVPALKMAGGPSFEVTLPKPKPKEIYTPDDDDIVRLLEYCRQPGREELLAAVILAAFGSMRRSEVCALTPADITGNVVTVSKALVRDAAGKWVVKEPKTSTSARRVVLPSFVMDMIPQDGPRIVNMTPGALSSRFDRAVKAAGIERSFSFHALRHYYVSAAHALQIADQYTMKMGGWRTDNVMKRHYRQTLTDVEKQAQAKLDAHALKLIKGSAGHETGHEVRKVQ